MDMAGSTHQKTSTGMTKSDVRLLLSAALFLGAVLLKTSGAPWADDLRERTVTMLQGGIPTQEVLQVAGQTLEGGGLSAVFAEWSQDTTPETEPDPASSQEDIDLTAVYAESGFGEDELASRIESEFPKEEDKTAYVMAFDTQNPVEGTKTSDFGERIHPISGKASFHYGLDIGAPEGTTIAAFASGTVREVGSSSSYGNYAILDHDEGFSTLYAHCSTVDVQQGDTVEAGDKIAEVGATGNATGNHLHFEVWRDGKALNPAHYVTY